MTKIPRNQDNDEVKAYSYIRFSSLEQARGDSMRRQLELSEAYAKKHKLELDRRLKLTDRGVSAFRSKNRVEGALGAFFRAVENGQVKPGSILLVESLDRLSRDQLSIALTSFLQVINAGITVITLADEMTYSKKSINENMGSLMMSIVVMAQAHEESAKKSKRLVASWENKRALLGEKKMTSVCPEWLQLNKARTEYLPIPERAAIVLRIFDLHNAGYGKRRIAIIFNRERIPTWGRGKRKAKGWHPSYIDKILSTRAVLGEFHPHRMEEGKRVPVGDPIPDYFPAVVTLSHWNQSNSGRVRTGGKTTEAIRNLFAGIAYEGGTEFKMTYVDKGGKGGNSENTRYLRSDRYRVEPEATVWLWNYDEIEWAFLRVMNDLDWHNILAHGKPNNLNALLAEVAQLEESKRQAERKLERLTEAIATSKQEIRPLVLALEKASAELDEIKTNFRQSKNTLLKIEADTSRFTESVMEFLELIKSARDTTNLDFRIRLREEIRNKVRRVEFFHSGWPRHHQAKHPWLNPHSIMIHFHNGAARVVLIQPGKRGDDIQIKFVNAAASQEVA